MHSGKDMDCPKCNNSMSFFKEKNSWQCRVCNEWHGHIEIQVPLSSRDTKGTSVILGIASAIVVIIIIVLNSELFFFWPWVGYFMLVWGAILPIIGSVLISLDKYKMGGYLQIIGSILFFPIGYIGIHGGLIALKLEKSNKSKRRK